MDRHDLPHKKKVGKTPRRCVKCSLLAATSKWHLPGDFKVAPESNSQKDRKVGHLENIGKYGELMIYTIHRPAAVKTNWLIHESMVKKASSLWGVLLIENMGM